MHQYLFLTAKNLYNLNPLKKSRKVEYVFARAIIIFLLRERGYGITQLANILDCNHATIIYHYNNHQSNMMFSEEYRIMYHKILPYVKENQEFLYESASSKINEVINSLKKHLSNQEINDFLLSHTLKVCQQ